MTKTAPHPTSREGAMSDQRTEDVRIVAASPVIYEAGMLP